MPETLDKTYDRILCKINGEDCQFALKILRWLTFSARPLTVKEVAEVIAIDAKGFPQFDPNKRFEDPRDILEICSSLISVEDIDTDSHTDSQTDADSFPDPDDATNIDTETPHQFDRWTKAKISLAHFSVKEYLVSDRIRHGPAIDYGLQEEDSNASIAEDCLVYLLHLIQPNVFASASLEQYPLARYAAEFWFEHVGIAGTTRSASFPLVQELFLSREEIFINWIRVYYSDYLFWDKSVMEQDHAPCLGLRLASALAAHTLLLAIPPM